MSADFLPDGYKEPTASNYMRLVDGDNTFRVLSSPIMGWEYWKVVVGDDGKEVRKPVRKKQGEDLPQNELEINAEGDLVMPKFFWALVVYNFGDQKIQILEITQKGIRQAIEALARNKKWGNPRDYNILITRTGTGFDTEYMVNPEPKEPIDPEIVKKYEAMKINLEALYSTPEYPYGGDPFKVEEVDFNDLVDGKQSF